MTIFGDFHLGCWNFSHYHQLVTYSQDSFHSHDEIALRYVPPGFKPFSLLRNQTVRGPPGIGFLLNKLIETIHDSLIW